MRRFGSEKRFDKLLDLTRGGLDEWLDHEGITAQLAEYLVAHGA